jgi:putative transposon-encoded protein
MVNKRDITINKVEGTPSKFGTGGAHICVPKEWLKETVVVVTKKTYEELQGGTSLEIFK